MPFEVSDIINSLSSNINNHPFLRSVFHNPFYLSMLIVLSILLILVFIIDITEISNYTSAFIKIFFYGLLSTSIFLWMHNNMILEDYEKKNIDNDVIKTIGNHESMGGTPTIPNYSIIQPLQSHPIGNSLAYPQQLQLPM